MNICFFLGGFHKNGGIGRVTAMLANQMAQSDNYHVTALCYYNPNLPNIYDVSPLIEQYFFLKTYSNMTKQLFYGGVKRLRQFILANNIDVLIACGALFYPISVLACKGIRTKCICWEHSDPEGNNDHKGQYWARKFGIKRSDVNVVLTKRALKVFKEKYGAENTVQIYNPVDEAVFNSAGKYNKESKKIISVGRLSYQKNFELAINIASRILPGHPEWMWDVYGTGEDYDKLQRLIEENGISKQFHLCGQVTDLYERYVNYSIMVMTSRYEGFPMSLLEGLGNGLPLVSFDIPTGPGEIIEDKVNGYLVDPFDVDCIVQRLEKMMADENMLVRMSIAGKQKADAFSQKEIISSWNKLLAELEKK